MTLNSPSNPEIKDGQEQYIEIRWIKRRDHHPGGGVDALEQHLLIDGNLLGWRAPKLLMSERLTDPEDYLHLFRTCMDDMTDLRDIRFYIFQRKYAW